MSAKYRKQKKSSYWAIYQSIISPSKVLCWLPLPFVLFEIANSLNQNASPGPDGISFDQFYRNIQREIAKICKHLCNRTCKPGHLLRAFIREASGKIRKIAISNHRDKLMDNLFALILNFICDPKFTSFSFGWRIGHSAKDALDHGVSSIQSLNTRFLLKLDLKDGFSSVNLKLLMAIVKQYIHDGYFIHLLNSHIRVGVYIGDKLTGLRRKRGLHQGQATSSVLFNIFIHDVIDIWFTNILQIQLLCNSFLTRFGDDFLFGFETMEDLLSAQKAITQRLGEYGLELNNTKTQIVDLSNNDTLEWLGFEVSMTGDELFIQSSPRKIEDFKVEVLAQIDRIASSGQEEADKLTTNLYQKLQGFFQYHNIPGNETILNQLSDDILSYTYEMVSDRSKFGSLHNWKQLIERTMADTSLPRDEDTVVIVRGMISAIRGSLNGKNL